MQAWGAKIRSDLMDKAIPFSDQSMRLSNFCAALKKWESSIKSVKAAQEFLNDAIVNSVALGQEDVFIPMAVNCEIEDIISYPFLSIGNLFNTTWKIEKCNGHFVIGESVAVDTYKFNLDVAALVPEQDHWKFVPVTRKSTGKPIPVAVTTLHVFDFLDSLSDKDKKSMLHDISRNSEEAHKKYKEKIDNRSRIRSSINTFFAMINPSNLPIEDIKQETMEQFMQNRDNILSFAHQEDPDFDYFNPDTHFNLLSDETPLNFEFRAEDDTIHE